MSKEGKEDGAPGDCSSSGQDDLTPISVRRLDEGIPGPGRLKTQLLQIEFLGKKVRPAEIPLRRALGIAAASEAASRGVPNPKRVYDLLRAAPGSRDGMLIVFRRRGGRPLLVAATDYVAGA